jgi:hypothetical protein
MAMTRKDIDAEAFGKLLKTWATGNNTYLQDGNSYPLPQSLQELKDQMKAAHAGTIPASFTSVRFVSIDENKLTIRLPPKAEIEQAETELNQANLRLSGVYPLPSIYAEMWFPDAAFRDRSMIAKFHNQRIGEFTTLFCM